MERLLSDSNKYMPEKLKKEIEFSLSFFPELKDYTIYFVSNSIRSRSFMLAQPKISTLLRNKTKREYVIKMKPDFFDNNPKFEDGKLPFNVFVGWMVHELGHILDYLPRNSINLMWFGIMYYFNKNFIRRAESTADKNAVERGLANYLLITKNFVRDSEYFSQEYINKLDSYYQSPKQIKEMVSKLPHLIK